MQQSKYLTRYALPLRPCPPVWAVLRTGIWRGSSQPRPAATCRHPRSSPALTAELCLVRDSETDLCYRQHILRTEQDVVVWWFLIKCWQFSVDNVQIIRLHNLQCSCSFTWLIILDNVANYEYVLWTLTVCRYTIRYCMSAVCIDMYYSRRV